MNRLKKIRMAEVKKQLNAQHDCLIKFIDVVRGEEPVKTSGEVKAMFIERLKEQGGRLGMADDAFNMFWDITWAAAIKRN